MDFGWTFTQNGENRTVDLPHDWDIYSGPKPNGATATGGGWFPAGKATYQKTFPSPSADITKLHFEGVYQHAEVFVNGQKAGQHAYGYTPFTVDVTPFLNKDPKKPNQLTVSVDNSQQPNCRWYSGSGIYRHVWLYTMPALHIAENGIHITTPEVSTTKATVQITVSVQNESHQTRHINDIEVTIPTEGTSLTTHISPPTSNLSPLTSHHLSLTINNPHLWSPDDPYLYNAVVKLKENGQVIDQQDVRFGIRSISFDAQQGFLLNGKKLLINGACVHHDHGLLGAMAFDAAEIRKVKLMKEAGFNLIRTAHNPPATAFLDACDSIGMLIIDEAFDGWRQPKNPYDYSTVIDSCYRDDIHTIVKRDRNHPSVISWSIGNEVMERKDIRVVTTARKLKQAILEMDDTRPVTEALCAWDSDWEIYDPHAEVLDVVGYNYMIHKHATDHQRDPKRVIWQTESFPRDAFNNWAVTHDYPYVVGDIVWTGLDYLGESGIGRYYYKGEREGEHYIDGGQPEWHGAYCGDVDITGWRKPISHYREMLWKDSAAVKPYIAVREPDGYHGKIHQTAWSVWPTWESWNWPGWEGKPIEVEIYTKASYVALYCNNTLIGKENVSRETGYKAVFIVDYEPGTLDAVTDESDAILSTADEPVRLRLTADRTTITADGQDLAFVTIEVVDSEGRVCPDAAIPCEISVSGRGKLLASASADLKDIEPYTSPRVTTWKGRAMFVVRSSRKAGQVKAIVKSTLPTANITLVGKTAPSVY